MTAGFPENMDDRVAGRWSKDRRPEVAKKWFGVLVC